MVCKTFRFAFGSFIIITVLFRTEGYCVLYANTHLHTWEIAKIFSRFSVIGKRHL